MPYTGTTPYTAQEFVPGQKALAQDITNMSYVLARLDTNASNAFCVKQKLLSADNQTVPIGKTSIAVTLKTIAADPLGMSTSNTDFTVPFDGIWTVSGYFATQEAGSLNGSGCWFRLNNQSGNGTLIAATTAPTGSISTSVTMPFSAGDVLTPYFQNSDTTKTANVWAAACSVVLVH